MLKFFARFSLSGYYSAGPDSNPSESTWSDSEQSSSTVKSSPSSNLSEGSNSQTTSVSNLHRRNTAPAVSNPASMSPTYSDTLYHSSSTPLSAQPASSGSIPPDSRQAIILRSEQRICRRIAEGKRRFEKISTLRQQVARFHPTTPFQPLSLPAELDAIFVPCALTEILARPDADTVIAKTLNEYEAQITALNSLLEMQNNMITQLETELHGCRIRFRTYDAMVSHGAPISEFSQHIQTHKRPITRLTSAT